MSDFILLGEKYYVRKDKILMFSTSSWIDNYKPSDSGRLVIKIIATMDGGKDLPVDYLGLDREKYTKKEVPELEEKFLMKFIREFENLINPEGKKVHI